MNRNTTSSSSSSTLHPFHVRSGGVSSSLSSSTTTTTSTAATTTTTSSVDDAKYDRRIKQRLLLHTQRQKRRTKMILDCRQLCIRIIIMVTLVLTLLYYIVSYLFLFTTISSLSSVSVSSSSVSDQASILQRTHLQPHMQPQQQKQQQQQQQQQLQQLPPKLSHPLPQQNEQELPSTASLDLQYQQLRSYFIPSSNHFHFNNNDLLSEELSSPQVITQKKQLIHVLEAWLHQEDMEIRNNVGSDHPRYTRPYLLPPLSDTTTTNNNNNNNKQDDEAIINRQRKKLRKNKLPYIKAAQLGNYFRVNRFDTETSSVNNNNNNNLRKMNALLNFHKKRQMKESDDVGTDNTNTNSNNSNKMKNPMKWQDEYDALLQKYGTRSNIPGPVVDYTDATLYEYPTVLPKPPLDGTYPQLQPLQQLLSEWPQNDDFDVTNGNQHKIQETLQHFDYQNPKELHMAMQYRDAELPFKLYNIPDVTAASHKWNDDDYIGRMFGSVNTATSSLFGATSTGVATIMDAHGHRIDIPNARGTAQESRNHYFAFYVAKQWDVEMMGLAPTRNIPDWNYTVWSNHAIYADAVRLTHDKPHFYWQSGVSPEERFQSSKQWTFISRDLPIFSTTTDNFFVFHVDEQKGIQCRFGERGVVAATHFDSGRNMVAMINGAKRYILSPPNQCSKLGIFKNKRSPIYRHSLLNFGHIQYLQQQQQGDEKDPDESSTDTSKMSPEEQAWLQRAASSQAVETVLKQGEVLYIPSHWFHYIVSLQKSAQCNVRSGIDIEGTHIFGGRKEVDECTD